MFLRAFIPCQSPYLIALDVQPILRRDQGEGTPTQVAFFAMARLIQCGRLIERNRGYGLKEREAARSAVMGVMSSFASCQAIRASVAKRHAPSNEGPSSESTLPLKDESPRNFKDVLRSDRTRSRQRHSRNSLHWKPIAYLSAAPSLTRPQRPAARRTRPTFAEQPDEIQRLIRAGVQTRYVHGKSKKKELAEWLQDTILRFNQARPAESLLRIPSAKTLCCLIDEYLDLSLARGLAADSIERPDDTSVETIDEKGKN